MRSPIPPSSTAALAVPLKQSSTTDSWIRRIFCCCCCTVLPSRSRSVNAANSCKSGWAEGALFFRPFFAQGTAPSLWLHPLLPLSEPGFIQTRVLASFYGSLRATGALGNQTLGFAASGLSCPCLRLPVQSNKQQQAL